MALRQFTDASGVEWTVYDVVPRADERRDHERREPAHDQAPEERRGDDRRTTVGGRPPRITRGWLCFESKGERRRLQPIPQEWPQGSDEYLSDLLQQARVAPRRVVTR